MPGPLFFLEPAPKFVNVSNCSDGVPWILTALGDCVETNLQYASVLIGLLSIVIWMCVGFPQMYQSCKHSETIEGLSVLFLCQWLIGDTSNLVGAILSGQLRLQIYTAIWYVFNDVVLLTQYTYFRCAHKRRSLEINIQEPNRHSQIVLCLGMLFMFSISMNIWSLPVSHLASLTHKSSFVQHSHTSRSLLSVNLQAAPIFRGPIDETGYAIGILSSIFYVGARSAQIRNNVKRQSTEGVSRIMFFMAILGNLTYGVSIFMRNQSKTFQLRHLPWIIGSIGVMFFDIFIVFQTWWYKRNRHFVGELGSPLLKDEH